MAKKGTKFNHYTKETKLLAVQMYLNQGYSYRQVAKELGVRYHTEVMSWVKKYNESGDSAFDKKVCINTHTIRRGRPKTKFKSLEEELEYLRMENEYLKKLQNL